MLFLFYLSAYIYMRERTTQMSKNYLSDPELTTKNPYWIERHRYYELKHFCLQYRIWKKARAAIDGMNPSRLEIAVRSQTGNVSNPTASAAEARLFYTNRIEMVENAARETDPVIGAFIRIFAAPRSQPAMCYMIFISPVTGKVIRPPKPVTNPEVAHLRT